MTLALHGKSKRRQMGLLTAALMAVVLAAVGGVLWMGVAGAVPQDPPTTGTIQVHKYIAKKNPNTPWQNVGKGGTQFDFAVHTGSVGGSVPAGASGVQLDLLTNIPKDQDVYLTETAAAGYTLYGFWMPDRLENGNSGDAHCVDPGQFNGTIQTSSPFVIHQQDWANYGDDKGVLHICAYNDPIDPDLTATKTNNVSGAINQGGNFDWTITVASANGISTFGDGSQVFVDNLPSGPVYSNLQTSGTKANLDCQLSSGTIACTASGGDFTLGVGQSFAVSVHVVPAANFVGNLTNPASGVGNTCKVDPGSKVSESNENNNTCSNTVVVGASQVLTRQVTIKKIVDNNPGDTTPFTIKDGTTGVGNVSVGTPLGPLTIDTQPHTFSEVVPAGYVLEDVLTTPGTLTGDCEAAWRDRFEQVEAQTSDPVGIVPQGTDNYTLCFVNIKTTSTVTVKKVYTLHGGSKDVPVVTVNDGTTHTPAINNAGQNDATHSEWNPVSVTTGNQAIFVSEDIDTSKWFTNALPTFSGTGCREAQPGQVAAENVFADPGAFVFVDVSVGADCVVTFHNEQIAQTRKIRIGKVTTTATHPQEFFTGTIAPGTPGTFSVNLPANQSAGPITDYIMANQNGQVVTETNVPANWTVNGYTVKADADGKGSCSPTESYSGTSANVPSGSGTYLVCIRNTYTPPPTTTPTPFNPPQICQFGCTPLIVNTPTPTVVLPTPTPTLVPPTATPTKKPVEAVEGAKTPGAIATPLAPSTGSGPGDGGSSANLFLAIIGIFSLSGGLALLGYGRKPR